jgi:hypothetical protein
LSPARHLTVEISGAEFRDTLLQNGESHIPVPIDRDVDDYMQEFLSKSNIVVKCVNRSNNGNWSCPDYPGHSQFSWQSNKNKLAARCTATNGELNFVSTQPGGDTTGMNISVSGYQNTLKLSPDASNLPAVLSTLFGGRGDTFKKLVQHLREIFPTVGNVSVDTQLQSNNAEILIWPTESMVRRELSFALSQSGTGVSQIIAILTAVMTIENAVLIIDEINSFLHPAAVKALLRILQTEYAQICRLSCAGVLSF